MILGQVITWKESDRKAGERKMEIKEIKQLAAILKKLHWVLI